MERGIYILGNEVFKVDLHLNCWRCFKKENDVLLDVGIMLNANTSFKTLAIFFPFCFNNENFEGLYKPTINCLDTIFNDKLGTETKDGTHNYTYVKKNGSINWGIYDIKIGDELEIIDLNDGTLVKFTPKDSNLANINSYNCYFRFRVSTTVKDIGTIFTPNKTKDYFLKSSIDDKEIVSFRINNMRDMSKSVEEYVMNTENLKCVDVLSVRLFFVASTEFEITTTPDRSSFSTRVLENELWKEYLSKKELADHSYCYFWKDLTHKKHYSFLFNTKKSRCNIKTILIYIAGLLGANWLSTIIYEGIKILLFSSSK